VRDLAHLVGHLRASDVSKLAVFELGRSVLIQVYKLHLLLGWDVLLLDEALAKLLEAVVGAELLLAISQPILATCWLSWIKERWLLALARGVKGHVVVGAVVVRSLVAGDARVVQYLLGDACEARL
jgi:hypothetical protein